MNIVKPEIKELISTVKARYGKSLGTSTDFGEFSLHLEKESGEIISVSTLKRLWGYVKDTHEPRGHTLDILSRYIGYKNFDDYCAWLKTSPVYNSSFFSTKQIASSELVVGQHVAIGWSPNRYLLLRYEGNSMYHIEESKASKLKAGDSFKAECFYMGYPLYLPYVIHENQRTRPFIAGRNGGLTICDIVANG